MKYELSSLTTENWIIRRIKYASENWIIRRIKSALKAENWIIKRIISALKTEKWIIRRIKSAFKTEKWIIRRIKYAFKKWEIVSKLKLYGKCFLNFLGNIYSLFSGITASTTSGFRGPTSNAREQFPRGGWIYRRPAHGWRFPRSSTVTWPRWQEWTTGKTTWQN